MSLKMNKMKRPVLKNPSEIATNEMNSDINKSTELSDELDNTATMKFLQIILKMDTELEKKFISYEDEMKKRKLIQNQMCDIISSTNISALHSKSSEAFLQLCNFEMCKREDSYKETNNEDEKISSDLPSNNFRKIKRADKDFISRNIELAKQYSMAQISLTDEDKLKLESLLTDIDSEEYSMEKKEIEANENSESQLKNEKKEDEENESSKVNYFKLKEEEMFTMKDLDAKLNELLKSYEEGDRNLDRQISSSNAEKDPLEAADKSGKYWKHYELEKRLERIEQELNDIAAQDTEERNKLEEMNGENSEKNFQFHSEEDAE